MKDIIFVSYRIADTGDVIGRIYDYLVKQFGEDRVFKDVQSIGLGLDYRNVINDALNGCRILLAVIGPDWLTVTDKEGNRRLEQPGDWVRLEIETALGRGIPVIPLLVKGASLPKEPELPKSIKDLAHRNATEIRLNDPDFGKDISWLVKGLEKFVRNESTGTLSQVNVSDLRRLMSTRMNLGEIENLWFDTLSFPMSDVMPQTSIKDACIRELLDRIRTGGRSEKMSHVSGELLG